MQENLPQVCQTRAENIILITFFKIFRLTESSIQSNARVVPIYWHTWRHYGVMSLWWVTVCLSQYLCLKVLIEKSMGWTVHQQATWGWSVRGLNPMPTMMTSSNENIFLVIGPLRGVSNGHRWISLTNASEEELWCFLWSAPKQTVEQTIKGSFPVIQTLIINAWSLDPLREALSKSSKLIIKCWTI